MSNGKRRRLMEEKQSLQASNLRTVLSLVSERKTVSSLRKGPERGSGSCTPQGPFQWDRSIAVNLTEGQGGSNHIPMRVTNPGMARNKKSLAPNNSYSWITKDIPASQGPTQYANHRDVPSNSMGTPSPSPSPKVRTDGRNIESGPMGFAGINRHRSLQPIKTTFATPTMPKKEHSCKLDGLKNGSFCSC